MHGDGIGGSEQAQRAPHHRSVGHGVAWRWNGASSVPREWRRGSRVRWQPRRRAVSTREGTVYRCGPRVWPGRPGSSWRPRSSAHGVAWGPRTRVRRWRQPASGGVAAASSVWRAEWRGHRGRGIGKERKEEDGTGIYIYATPLYSRCHPPTGSKGITPG